ncbi:MAG: hypothetical protein U5N55_10445 [Cypionkella sp.]|nr:hypothetical protein [Cypionkella sp.]
MAASPWPVQTRRADIFTAFDANGDDSLYPPPKWRKWTRCALCYKKRWATTKLRARGSGKVQGNVKGQEKGHGMGGQITRADFVAKSKGWLAKKDRNGDSVATSGDFGRM